MKRGCFCDIVNVKDEGRKAGNKRNTFLYQSTFILTYKPHFF